MERLGRTGIEYGDVSFNTITGCQHNCPWGCWAEQLAMRRKEDFHKATWHPERLGLPFKTTHGLGFQSVNPNLHNKVDPMWFDGGVVQDMVLVNFQGDMFGNWVPEQYIDETLESCGEAPWHQYLFLTKNPTAYNVFRGSLDHKNYWLGTSVEHGMYPVALRLRQLWEATDKLQAKRWVSFEPLLGPVAIKEHLPFIARLDWVVIGALTGKKAKQPKYEWVVDLIHACNEYRIPYFIKNNLGWPGKNQEFPK